MVVFSIPFLATLALAFLFTKFVRTKTKVYADWLESNKGDPEFKELLVIFNWSPKVLYSYTILLCFINGIIMLLKNSYPRAP